MTVVEKNILPDIMRTFDNMPSHARVWIYQSSRNFSDVEVATLKKAVAEFVTTWTAHQAQLTTSGDVLLNRFLVLVVDEAKAAASGCSIDKSVHFIKNIEQEWQISLFDRMNFGYWADNTLNFVAHNALSSLYTEGGVSEDTLFIDNLVESLGDMRVQWFKPLKNSWHWRFV